ncbi:MAG: 4Fe-4S binding protein [Candidatus Brocadiaceae bacterium]|nr:4Fe-4S binding protein [Candidatus Brocadiaceae bacterium]
MAEPKKPPLTARLSRWRALVQTGFLFVWLGPLGLRAHNVCAPVFHCYSCPLASFACPIGIIANFSALHVFPFLAFGTLLLVGGLIGGLVCGWICPFGFLQDLIGRLPTPKFRLPAWSGYIRFAVLLALVLILPFLFGKDHALFLCRLCPVGALEGAGPSIAKAALAGDAIIWPNTVKIVIVVLILTAMFLTWRPWCRLFCPLGAVYGLLNRLSFVSLGVDREKCTQCGRCARECRYGVDPAASPNSSRCIRCFECTRCESLHVQTPFSRPKPVSAPAESGIPTGSGAK